jgi:hypothetical protein
VIGVLFQLDYFFFVHLFFHFISVFVLFLLLILLSTPFPIFDYFFLFSMATEA